jgi:peptide/nickel transport system substrate-binding protein
MTRCRIRWAGRGILVVATLAAVAAALGVTAGRTEAVAPAVGPTLVIDRLFSIETSDPQRAFEPTAAIVDRAVYDTLFTYRGGDLAHPIPLLVTRWSASKDAKTFVFQLRRNVHFADGSSLTSADVLFSFRRLINLKDSPSNLLPGVTVSAPRKYTVVLHSATPYSALPSILANTSLGIVNSRLLRKHGGTDGPNADKTDKAERWLNSSASAGAGSGPYLLKSYSTRSRITLVPNPRYWGAKKAAFRLVVIRNTDPPAQLIDVGRGKHEVAVDLSSHQAQTIKGNKHVRVSEVPSTWVFWLFTNNNSKVSAISSNKHFQQAVRYAVDYTSIVKLGGPGAIQAPGIIPSMFLGALPRKNAVHRNLAKAKSELAASGVGSQHILFEYPSDLTIDGVPFASMAERIRASLQAAGFHVDLGGEPFVTWLKKYREGKIAFGLSLWNPDYPDPSDYLAFTPGQSVGLRAGWTKGSDPTIEKLAAKAGITTAAGLRKKLYQELQIKLNQSGPFFPLIQPAQAFVATRDLNNAVFNPVYELDVTRVSPK